MLLNLNNVRKVDVYFGWKLIEQDPDDNKFVDAAIAGSADFIVTNDAHFQGLILIDFPKVNVISIDTFLDLISNQPLT
ncbi:PIN domain-containing protein [Mucilaginibacter oryzae]|uniref:PIN domain-containing protein n=2 Tax=Mucilaginibacter oryzae TaxID=468058 RepID=A0A316HCX7_9SPHI|nr:PIN domain-containing protein [Mucilaginibacter oryzae]